MTIKSISGRRRRTAERGVTLIIALIALVILTIGAVAMVRSTSTSLFIAGNLAFKRDLANQSERAIITALTDLRTGGLSTDTVREANRNASNYSASVLASSSQGIPNILLDDSAYAASGYTATDITDTSANITIRYVVDRQCSAAGSFSNANCQFEAISGDAKGGGGKGGGGGTKSLGATVKPIYRVSVRVTGPRGVQSFAQTTAVF